MGWILLIGGILLFGFWSVLSFFMWYFVIVAAIIALYYLFTQ